MKKLVMGTVAICITVFMSALLLASGKDKEGRALYSAQCASCHGDNGKAEAGLPGTALNNRQFLNTVSDRDLFHYIKYGRQNTRMPAYEASLTDEQINHIVSWLRSWQKQKDSFQKPVRFAGDATQGQALYKTYCAMCHGADAKGKPGMGTALSNSQYLKYTTDEQMWISIAYGREGTTMGPALKGQKGIKQLSEEEVSNIVSYIRSFQKE